MVRFSSLFLVIVVFAMAQPPVACVVTQVDNTLFPSGGKVTVYAVSSMAANCPEQPNVEFRQANGVAETLNATYNIRYVLDRWAPLTGVWERIGDKDAMGKIPSDSKKRTELFTLSLPDSLYKLSSFSGDTWLESVHFVVGGFDNLPVSRGLDVRGLVPDGFHPYRIAMSDVTGNYVYFRRELGDTVVGGYLYQIIEGETIVFPTWLEQVDPQAFLAVNQPHLRGGTFDSAWARAKLPKSGWFNFAKPIYGSAALNGVTVQGVVFDPTNPFENVGSVGYTAPRPSW